jgi:hypothetical protein
MNLIRVKAEKEPAWKTYGNPAAYLKKEVAAVGLDMLGRSPCQRVSSVGWTDQEPLSHIGLNVKNGQAWHHPRGVRPRGTFMAA